MYNPLDEVITAEQCTICGASADLLPVGIYQCQVNPNHVGDRYVGIFSDLSMPDERKEGEKMKRDQYCFWCGDYIGHYQSYAGDIEACSKIECQKAAAEEERAEMENARWDAEEDGYSRYR